MTVRDLLRLLMVCCCVGCVVLGVTTFAAFAVGHRSDALGWLLAKLNLCREQNPATWFASAQYLVCAVSFLPLLAAHRSFRRFRLAGSAVLAICVAGCVWASADEMLMFHEILALHVDDATTLFDEGKVHPPVIWWLLMYTPPLIGMLALVALALRRFIVRIPAGAPARRRAWTLLALVPLAVCASLIFEFVSERFDIRLLGPIEEVCELTATLSLIGCNTTIARALKL